MAVIANKMAAIISAILLADFLAKAPSTFFVIALTAAFALTKVAFAFLSLALIAAFTLGLVGLRSCFPRAIRFLVALIYAFNVDLLRKLSFGNFSFNGSNFSSYGCGSLSSNLTVIFLTWTVTLVNEVLVFFNVFLKATF